MKYHFLAILMVCVLSIMGCGRPAAFSMQVNQYTVHEPPAASTFRPDIVPVWIDKDFNLKDKIEVEAALAEWNFVLNGYRQYRIEDASFSFDLDVLKQVVETGQGLLILNIPESAVPEDDDGVLGWVDNLGSPVVNIVASRIGTRDLKLIVMHEMAHSMGVPHVRIDHTLMSPYYQVQIGCIDEITVRQLSFIRRALDWDFKHMNWCVVP